MAVSGPGFLGNLSISWNQDLNVIIGGRGVGKSAILESLRYAFAIPPRSDQSKHEELVRHALGSGGRVEVILDRPLREGKVRQYRIVRAWGEEPRTFQVNPEKPLRASPSELLTPTGASVSSDNGRSTPSLEAKSIDLRFSMSSLANRPVNARRLWTKPCSHSPPILARYKTY